MFEFLTYTFLTVLTVDLLATSGDITMTWTSPILPKLYSNDTSVNPFEHPINADEESWISSLINIGAIVGPLPYGIISERFGRKVALLSIAIPHMTSYLILAFAQTVPLYYFARLLGGLAVGGGYTLLPMYVAEVAEDSNRGMLSVTLNIFWTFGNLLPYVIGPYLPINWFNIILACVPVSFFCLFIFIAPETPYFLISKNRIHEAEVSLMKLRGHANKAGVEKEMEHIKKVLETDSSDKGTFLDLFKSKIYIKALCISLFLIISQQMSGINCVLFYTQEIFHSAGVEGISDELSSIIIGLVTFSASFITPFICDRLGRRLLLLSSALAMAVAHGALGTFFYLKSDNTDVSGISWLPIASLVVYIVTFTVGFGPVPWTVSSELFPAGVKSMAASLVSATCWTTSFLVTKFFNDLNAGLGSGGTFWLFGGFCVLAFVVTFLFVPETKGKSFREIQEILAR